ncbi:MAG: sulfotransferase family 2 domain-containing protein [Bacteroidota bacterium]
MRISHRYQFIFFANPKTASSSVRQFLNPYTDVHPALTYLDRSPENPFYPHISPQETRSHFQDLGWDFNGYNKFVFVRNPWARLVSLYEHIQRDFQEPIPFKEWLYTIRPDGSGGGGEDHHRWRKYGAYSIEHYIKDGNGNILVDKIIRMEDIQKALRPFLAAMGLPKVYDAPLNHSNKGKRKQVYQKYYDEESKAYVHEWYRYDIVNYDYSFEERQKRKFFALFNLPIV